MLDNCKYNKVKLLADLSSIVWFIDKCCKKDMQAANEEKCCQDSICNLRDDLEKHINKLQEQLKL